MTLAKTDRQPVKTVQRNTVANFIGRSWNALLSLLLVPFYIRLMGAEAYGLVGFFVSLQMILSLLEMGLGTTATKEVARLSGSPNPGSKKEMGDLVRTLEVFYFGLAALAAVMVLLSADILAGRWFNPRALSVAQIKNAILIMGCIIAARMPFSLYSGALMGLQRHVGLNGIIMAAATVKHAGAIIVLLLSSSPVIAFFMWNLIAEVLQTALGYLYWRKVHGPGNASRFSVDQIKKNWRFATGMSIVGVTNVALSQADKLFVSKMFPLETFGYYSAMWTVAGGLFFLTYPIVTALFPRYAQLFGTGDSGELYRLFRKSNRILSALMLPLAVTLLLFAEDIIAVWIPMAADKALLTGVFRVLVGAVVLNCLFNLPANIQLAYGWTRLLVSVNLIWAPLLPMLMWGFASNLGLVGVPVSWLLYNLFCVTAVAYVSHRKLFDAASFPRFFYDIGVPFLAAGGAAWIFAAWIPVPAGIAGKCVVLGLCLLWAEAASLMTVSDVRSMLFQAVRRPHP